jgi:hypothetical protein
MMVTEDQLESSVEFWDMVPVMHKDFQGMPFACLNWRGRNYEDYRRDPNFEAPKIFLKSRKNAFRLRPADGISLSNCCHSSWTIFALLNSFHCFILTMGFGSGWLSWSHYDALVHFSMSLSRFHGLTGVCGKPQRSQVSVSLVMNVGTMRRDRICPQTATMQEGMFVEYGSLSNFESVVAH